MSALSARLFPYLEALGPYLRRHSRTLWLGYLWVVIHSALALAVPWIVKRAVDDFAAGRGDRVWMHAAWILAASAASGVFLYLMRWSLIGLSRKIEYELRRDFFDHLSSLSLPFFQRSRTGDLMARATNDLNAVRDVLGPSLMYGLNTSTTVVISVVLMVRIDPILAVASLAPVPVLAYFVSRFSQETHRRSMQVQDHYGELSNAAQENLAGIRVVKGYGQESAESAHFEEMSHEYLTRNMSLVRYRSLFTSTIGVLSGSGPLILLWLGGTRVIEGHLTLGELVAFMGYLSILTWPFISIGWIISNVQRGEAAMQRMVEVWNQRPEITSGTSAPADAPATLRFEGVSFRYPRTLVSAGSLTPTGGAESRLILSDIDLTIPAGSTLAIVGRTAAGKSSLVQMIPRLYDVTAGRITLDGVDLRELHLASLRGRIGVVPQDSFLFSDTLAANLRVGKENATEAELWDALERARFKAEVEALPDGLATRVGERGITLSGGQRQRMALARALLLDPPILILDDALSAVDKVTEEALLTTIRALRSGRTLLLIAHRISTVRQADRIVVLDQGRIAEQGTHDALIAQGGLYADMARRQALEEALAGDEALGAEGEPFSAELPGHNGSGIES